MGAHRPGRPMPARSMQMHRLRYWFHERQIRRDRLFATLSADAPATISARHEDRGPCGASATIELKPLKLRYDLVIDGKTSAHRRGGAVALPDRAHPRQCPFQDEAERPLAAVLQGLPGGGASDRGRPPAPGAAEPPQQQARCSGEATAAGRRRPRASAAHSPSATTSEETTCAATSTTCRRAALWLPRGRTSAVMRACSSYRVNKAPVTVPFSGGAAGGRSARQSLPVWKPVAGNPPTGGVLPHFAMRDFAPHKC